MYRKEANIKQLLLLVALVLVMWPIEAAAFATPSYTVQSKDPEGLSYLINNQQLIPLFDTLGLLNSGSESKGDGVTEVPVTTVEFTKPANDDQIAATTEAIKPVELDLSDESLFAVVEPQEREQSKEVKRAAAVTAITTAKPTTTPATTSYLRATAPAKEQPARPETKLYAYGEDESRPALTYFFNPRYFNSHLFINLTPASAQDKVAPRERTLDELESMFISFGAVSKRERRAAKKSTPVPVEKPVAKKEEIVFTPVVTPTGDYNNEGETEEEVKIEETEDDAQRVIFAPVFRPTKKVEVEAEPAPKSEPVAKAVKVKEEKVKPVKEPKVKEVKVKEKKVKPVKEPKVKEVKVKEEKVKPVKEPKVKEVKVKEEKVKPVKEPKVKEVEVKEEKVKPVKEPKVKEVKVKEKKVKPVKEPKVKEVKVKEEKVKPVKEPKVKEVKVKEEKVKPVKEPKVKEIKVKEEKVKTERVRTDRISWREEPVRERQQPMGSFAFKSNLLYDAVSAVNLELEIPIANNWSIAYEWLFPWWMTSTDGVNGSRSTLQIMYGALEAKYWIQGSSSRELLTGWNIGLSYGQGLYDVEYNSTGWQGEGLYSASLNVGYAHAISRNFRLEYGIGFGIVGTEYRAYNDIYNGYYWQGVHVGSGYVTAFLPTRARVSLVYMLKYFQK